MAETEISEGTVFCRDIGKRTLFRRVVAIFMGKVCYSVGSNKNRFCSVAAFVGWSRKAQKIHL